MRRYLGNDRDTANRRIIQRTATAVATGATMTLTTGLQSLSNFTAGPGTYRVSCVIDVTYQTAALTAVTQAQLVYGTASQSVKPALLLKSLNERATLAGSWIVQSTAQFPEVAVKIKKSLASGTIIVTRANTLVIAEYVSPRRSAM